MSYEDKTIKEVITLISDNKIYLPAIQRKFIWKPDQILSFFDSIMKGYPIGTFLFWKLKGKETINQYTFYKFIQEYHQRDRAINEIAPSPHRYGEITGVLDGQQRLSSLYIALQGTYSHKQPYRRWNDDHAFPKTRLCLNLLKIPNDEDEEENEYEFEFLTDYEIAGNDEKHFWLPIKKVIEWRNDSEYIKYTKSVNQLENEIFLSNITTLWNKITKDKLISYFEVLEEDLDKIVKIFVRVNMGGTILSKTDLLFSTIVANWQEGRNEIESVLELINHKGESFDFNNDFIMRSCLVLTDSPVLFKVKTFKKANILKIRNEWNNIKNAIHKTVDLLVEFGYNRYNLTSQMAVTIIAYFIYKGGPLTEDNKKAIRKYLVLSMLNRIYGGRPDQVISKIRDALREKKEKKYILKQNKFSLADINNNLTLEKSLSITDEELDEILDYKKGAYTFMVLSMLYPNIKLNQVKFHQDHIHPNSFLCDFEKMDKVAIPKEKHWDYYFQKDKLPNLQLLEGSENESKNQTLFSEWFDKEIKDKKKYKKDHFIPEKVSLEIANFDVFFEKRKELLKNKIKKILMIKL